MATQNKTLLQLEAAVKSGRMTTEDYLYRSAVMYEKNPSMFTEEDVDHLESQFKKADVPFQRDLAHGETSILQMSHQMIGGMFEGFTTFNVANAPEADTSGERIVRSVGHLIGFVPDIIIGVLGLVAPVPGGKAVAASRFGKIGLAARKILSPVSKAAMKGQNVTRMASHKLANKIVKTTGVKSFRKPLQVWDGNKKKMVDLMDPLNPTKPLYGIRSLPMQFADHFMDKGAKLLKNTTGVTRKNLQRTLTNLGVSRGIQSRAMSANIARNIIHLGHGGAHLGLAGFASNHPWASGNEGGWKQTMESAMHMGIAGVVFRGIGTAVSVSNLMKNPVTRPFADKYLRQHSEKLYSDAAVTKMLQSDRFRQYTKGKKYTKVQKERMAKTETQRMADIKEQQVDTLLKAMAGAGYGYATTASHDLPLPEQIYEILLGMFFSAGEQPLWRTRANQFIINRSHLIKPTMNTTRAKKYVQGLPKFKQLETNSQEYIMRYFDSVRRSQDRIFDANPRLFFESMSEAEQEAAMKATKKVADKMGIEYMDKGPQSEEFYNAMRATFGKELTNMEVDWYKLDPREVELKLSEISNNVSKYDINKITKHMLDLYNNDSIIDLNQQLHSTNDFESITTHSFRNAAETMVEIGEFKGTAPAANLKLIKAVERAEGNFNTFLNQVSKFMVNPKNITRFDTKELRRSFNVVTNQFITGPGTGQILQQEMIFNTKTNSRTKKQFTYNKVNESKKPANQIETKEVKLSRMPETEPDGTSNVINRFKNTIDAQYGKGTSEIIQRVGIADGKQIRYIPPLASNSAGEPFISMKYWEKQGIPEFAKKKLLFYGGQGDTGRIVLLKYPWLRADGKNTLTKKQRKFIYNKIREQDKSIGKKNPSQEMIDSVVGKYIWRLRFMGMTDGKNLSGKKAYNYYKNPLTILEWAENDLHKSISSFSKRLKLPYGIEIPMKPYFKELRKFFPGGNPEYDPNSRVFQKIKLTQDNEKHISPYIMMNYFNNNKIINMKTNKVFRGKNKSDREEFVKRYHNRTYRNATGYGYPNGPTDFTLGISVDSKSAGMRLTEKFSRESENGKNSFIGINPSSTSLKEHTNKIVDHIVKHAGKEKLKDGIILNIAGNSINKFMKFTDRTGTGWTQKSLDRYVSSLLIEVKKKLNIKEIRTGGQSGADEAGAKAGAMAGVKNVIVLQPKGFRYQTVDGKDALTIRDREFDFELGNAIREEGGVGKKNKLTGKTDLEQLQIDWLALYSKYADQKSKPYWKEQYKEEFFQKQSHKRWDVPLDSLTNTGSANMVWMKNTHGKIPYGSMNNPKEAKLILSREADWDGISLTVPEMIKEIAKIDGQNTNVGSIKTTINIPSFINPGKGEISLKHLLVAADPAYAKWMRDNDVLMINHMTTPKEGRINEKDQLEFREGFKPDTIEAGITYPEGFKAKELQENNLYKFRIDDIYVNSGAKEDFTKIGNIRISKPIFDLATKTNMDMDMLEKLLVEDMQGTEKANRKFVKDVVNDRKAFSRKNLDIDDININQLNDYTKNNYYKKEHTQSIASILKQVFKQTNSLSSEVDFQKKIEMYSELELAEINLRDLYETKEQLEMSGYHHQTLARHGAFVEAALKLYTTERMNSPRIKHSATVLLREYDPITERKFNIKHDEFLMSEGLARVIKVPIRDKQDNIIQVLTGKEYFDNLTEMRDNNTNWLMNSPAIKTGETYKEVLENVRFSGKRDPVNSISNVRIWKMKGYIEGRKGLSIVVDAFNKRMMSGADNDGDKANIFIMGKEWNDSFGRKEVQFAHNKNNNPFEVMKSFDDHNEISRLTGAVKEADLATSYHILNPLENIKQAQNSGKGFSSLGMADVGKKAFMRMHSLIEQGKTDFGEGVEISNAVPGEKGARRIDRDSEIIANELVDAVKVKEIDGYSEILRNQLLKHFNLKKDGKPMNLVDTPWDKIVEQIPFLTDTKNFQLLLRGKESRIPDQPSAQEIVNRYMDQYKGVEDGWKILGENLSKLNLNPKEFTEILPESESIIKMIEPLTKAISNSEIGRELRGVDLDYHNLFLTHVSARELKKIGSTPELFRMHTHRALANYLALHSSEGFREVMTKHGLREPAMEIIRQSIRENNAIKLGEIEANLPEGQTAPKRTVLHRLNKKRAQDKTLEFFDRLGIKTTTNERIELKKSIDNLYDMWWLAFPVLRDNPLVKSTNLESLYKEHDRLQGLIEQKEIELRLDPQNQSLQSKLSDLYKQRGGNAKKIVGSYNNNDRVKSITPENYRRYMDFTTKFYETSEAAVKEVKRELPEKIQKSLEDINLNERIAEEGHKVVEEMFPVQMAEQISTKDALKKFPKQQPYIEDLVLKDRFVDFHVSTNGRWSGNYLDLFRIMQSDLNMKAKDMKDMTRQDFEMFVNYLESEFKLSANDMKIAKILEEDKEVDILTLRDPYLRKDWAWNYPDDMTKMHRYIQAGRPNSVTAKTIRTEKYVTTKDGDIKRIVPVKVLSPTSMFERVLNNTKKIEELSAQQKPHLEDYKDAMLDPYLKLDDYKVFGKYKDRLSDIATAEREYNDGKYPRKNELDLSKFIYNQAYEKAQKDKIEIEKEMKEKKEEFIVRDIDGKPRKVNLDSMIKLVAKTHTKAYTDGRDRYIGSNFLSIKRDSKGMLIEKDGSPITEKGPLAILLDGAAGGNAKKYKVPPSELKNISSDRAYVKDLKEYLYIKRGLKLINMDKIHYITNYVLNNKSLPPDKINDYVFSGQDMNWILYELNKLNYVQEKMPRDKFDNPINVSKAKGPTLKKIKEWIEKYERENKIDYDLQGEITSENLTSNAYAYQSGHQNIKADIENIKKFSKDVMEPWILGEKVTKDGKEVLPQFSMDQLSPYYKKKLETGEMTEPEIKQHLYDQLQFQINRLGVKGIEERENTLVEGDIRMYDSYQTKSTPGRAFGPLMRRGAFPLPHKDTRMSVPFRYHEIMSSINIQRMVLLANHMAIKDFQRLARKDKEIGQMSENWINYVQIAQKGWMNRETLYNPMQFGYTKYHYGMLKRLAEQNDEDSLYNIEYTNKGKKIKTRNDVTSFNIDGIRAMVRKGLSGEYVRDLNFIDILRKTVEPSRGDQYAMKKRAYSEELKKIQKKPIVVESFKPAKKITNLKGYVGKAKDTLWVFGDNNARKGTGGSAEIRGLSNAIGVRTKWSPDKKKESYFTDADRPKIEKLVQEDINTIIKTFNKGDYKKIKVIGELGAGLATAPKKYKMEGEQKILSWINNQVFKMGPKPDDAAVKANFESKVHEQRVINLQEQVDPKNIDKIGFFKQYTVRPLNYTFSTNPAFYTSESASTDAMEWLNRRAKKFGLGRIINLKDLPEDIDTRRRALRTSMNTLARWEGKYNLLSLLYHPKAWMTNVYSGEANIIGDVGFDHWKSSIRHEDRVNILRGEEFQRPDPRNPGQFTTEKINPRSAKEDVNLLMTQKGIISGTIEQDTLYDARFKGAEAKNFFRDLNKKMKQKFIEDPSLLNNTNETVVRYAKEVDKTVLELSNIHGVSDAIVKHGALFMRHSEMLLRTHTAIAAYKKALNEMNVTGDPFGKDRIINRDFVWDYARMIVERSQFIYHATRRPHVANTPLGKMMTRFHPFTWNSLRRWHFAKKDADAARFVKDMEATKRLRRMTNIAVVQLGLASVFFSSLFEHALAPPFGWLEDIVQLLYGDDEEKRKAFYNPYGVPALSPLAVVTPPTARLPLGPIRAGITGDWDSYWQYTLPASVPFGRLGASAFKTLDNPVMFAENLFGLPIHRLQQRMTRESKQAEKYWEDKEKLEEFNKNR